MAFSYINAFGRLLGSSGTASKAWIGTVGADVLWGGVANDIMRGNGGGDTYRGGLGDDTYVLSSSKDVAVEAAGEGTDTIRSSVHHVLEANIENLILEGPNAWYGGGNALDNVIIGNEYANQIDGKGGNDVLVGGGGADTFVVTAGNGSDVIADYAVGTDRIRLGGYGLSSFSQIEAHITQAGKDTVLSFDNGERLILSGVQASSLTAADFSYDLDSAKFTLGFADEFNALNLDARQGGWRTEYGNGNPGSVASHTLQGEAEVYTDPTWAGTGSKPLGVNPFAIHDGVLSITAAPASDAVKPFIDGHTYTSGLLTSKFSYSQQYGYFEIRAALPAGDGLWPAFWLLPTDNSWPPELDVFEMLGKDPDVVYMTTHGKDNGVNTMVQDRAVLDTTQFHTYGVDWNADRIIFYIDGMEVARQDTPAVMKKEMYMLIDLAVGGAKSWAGPASASTGTGEMKIDYVHAYRTADTVSATVNGTHYAYDLAPVAAGATVATPLPAVSPAPMSAAPALPPVVAPPAPAPVPPAFSTFTGTSANDTFTVSSSADRIIEAKNGGVDTAIAAVTYTLPDNVENLGLAARQSIDGTGNALDNRLIGNEAGNVLTGLGGNDYLDGHGGADTLIGGQGDDTYIVGNPAVSVVEVAGQGNDTVIASIGYVLGADVENLRLTGMADIAGTGNALDNRLIGNDGANVLTGLGGNDYLDGGAGIDTLVGGAGNDTYVVDQPADRVIEGAGEGTDTVLASVAYRLSAHVENLMLTGIVSISATGNELANRLIGNVGANLLVGGDGADTLMGGAGDDTLIGGNENDALYGGTGADTFAFQGHWGSDTIADFQAGVDKVVLVDVDPGKVNLTHSGTSTMIIYGGDTITLVGAPSAGLSDIRFESGTDFSHAIALLA